MVSNVRFTEEMLRSNFHKNVNYLSLYYPQLLQMLTIPQNAISINIDHEGRVDAIVGSLMVYGGDAYRKSLEQFKRFEELPVRLLPPLTIKGYTEDTLISQRFGKRICELTGYTINTPQHPVEDYMSTLMVVGLGFGFHLQMLLERYYVQNLMIVDIPLFAHLSLYTLDWEKLIQTYSQPDRRMIVLISDDFLNPERVDAKLQEITTLINSTTPAIFYWGYYFEHLNYNPPLLIKEWLSKHTTIMDFFKGFFDDELWSLEWTLEKIYKKIPLFYGGHKVPEGSIAFVVGAGPSLDESMEKLFEYKDRAVIFSCGSAITALERVGLVPDYHIEIERTKATYDMLSEVNRAFLKKTTLIANNPLWTDCFDLFKEGYMYRKLNDTGSSLLDNTGAPFIWNTGPTVTASGVAIAADLGFGEIYLFGVDLGSRDPQKHHSKATNYYKEDSVLSRQAPELNIPYPANFGGIAYTNNWFAWTAQSIEATIRRKKIRVYNTSDGIKIEGAIPLRHQDVRIEKVQNKPILKSIIKKNFRNDYINHINLDSVQEMLNRQFTSLILNISSLAKRDYFDMKDVGKSILDFSEYIKAHGETIFYLTFHNSYLWTTAAMGRAMGLAGAERDSFMKKFWQVYTEFLKEAHSEVMHAIQRVRSKGQRR